MPADAHRDGPLRQGPPRARRRVRAPRRPARGGQAPWRPSNSVSSHGAHSRESLRGPGRGRARDGGGQPVAAQRLHRVVRGRGDRIDRPAHDGVDERPVRGHARRPPVESARTGSRSRRAPPASPRRPRPPGRRRRSRVRRGAWHPAPTRGEGADGAVRERQQRRRRGVDVAVRDGAARAGRHRRDLADEHPGEVEDVDRLLHDRAAGELPGAATTTPAEPCPTTSPTPAGRAGRRAAPGLARRIGAAPVMADPGEHPVHPLPDRLGRLEVGASGFSTNSGSPAAASCASAEVSAGRWANGGTHTYTASRSRVSSAATSSTAPVPNCAAKVAARAGSTSVAATRVTSAKPERIVACRVATPPVPTTPTRRIGFLGGMRGQYLDYPARKRAPIQP